MSTKKTPGIPLAELLRPDPPARPPKHGAGFVLHLDSPLPNRNVAMLMGEAHGDPRLRQAIAYELAKQANQSASLRRGGAKGRQNKRTASVRAHIRHLILVHPRLKTSAQLWRHRDVAIVGVMAEKTFADHVRAVRKK